LAWRALWALHDALFSLCSRFWRVFSPLPSFGLQRAYLSALFPSTVLHHFSFHLLSFHLWCNG
jgi:hypothetical protein